MSEKFDVTVIGGGPGGYVCAIRLSQLGLKTACIEYRGSLGGTCLHLGCIPSKSLISSAGLYRNLKKAKDYGISLNQDFSADLNLMISQKNKIVSNLEKGIFNLFKCI